MFRQATCAANVSCLFWKYSFIGKIPVLSSVSATREYSHSLLVIRRTVIPTILLYDRLWNPYSNFIMSTVTTQLLLPYNNTN